MNSLQELSRVATITNLRFTTPNTDACNEAFKVKLEKRDALLYTQWTRLFGQSPVELRDSSDIKYVVSVENDDIMTTTLISDSFYVYSQNWRQSTNGADFGEIFAYEKDDSCDEIEQIYFSLNSSLNLKPAAIGEEIEDAVFDFCKKENLLQEFYAFDCFIKKCFINIININVKAKPDPEIKNKNQVIVEVFIKDSIRGIIDMQNNFFELVFKEFNGSIFDKFVLKCEKYG
ncbi:MAG: hypothetical protein HQL26_02240 [Candidatus Omnitrophica bacterium]|nr:hypothetical protein [Candidatus Omnitrophota bacterium]